MDLRGPWRYEEEARGEARGADKELLDEAMGRVGAIVGGATRMRQRGRGAATIRSACRSSS